MDSQNQLKRLNRLKRIILSGIILVVAGLLFVVAWNASTKSPASANNKNNVGQAQGSTSVASTTTTSQIVTPKSSGGSPGTGAQVITTPSPVPGGPAGSQQVVLNDRTLIIYSVTKQQGASADVTLINLNLAVQNTSGISIQNLANFFELLGSEGDTFTYQSNSSDTFYGTINANATNTGQIVFQIPTGAATNLRLLYRPEVATEAVIVPLTFA